MPRFMAEARDQPLHIRHEPPPTQTQEIMAFDPLAPEPTTLATRCGRQEPVEDVCEDLPEARRRSRDTRRPVCHGCLTFETS